MLRKKISMVLSIALLTSMFGFGTVYNANAADTDLQTVSSYAVNSITGVTVNSVGNKVTVSGTIGSSSGKNVTVMVLNPDGTTDYVGQTQSTAGGKFTFSFTADQAVSGNYTLKLGGDGINSPYEQTFTMISPLPAIPSGITAVSESYFSVSLNWTAVSGATGYNVYRASSRNGKYVKVNSSMVTSISYLDSELSSDTTYYYKISAINAAGESDKSNEAVVTTKTHHHDGGSSGGNSSSGTTSGGSSSSGTTSGGSSSGSGTSATTPTQPSQNKGTSSVVDSNTVNSLISSAAQNNNTVVLPAVTNNSGSISIPLSSAASIENSKLGVQASIGNVSVKMPDNLIDLSKYASSSSQANVQISKTDVDENSAKSMFALKDSSMQPVGSAFNLGLTVTDSTGKSNEIHNFENGSQITVSIKLSSSDVQGIDTSKLTAYYFNKDTDKWEDVGGTFDSSTNTVTFTTTHLSIYSVMLKKTTDADWNDLSVKDEAQASNKNWTVKFDQDIAQDADNLKNVYVSADSTGNTRMDGVTVQVDSQNKNQIIVKAPAAGYESGKTYYLFVYYKMKSVQSNMMSKGIRVKFAIK